jgi:hypothetical protein
MAQQPSLGEISSARNLSPHFDLRKQYSHALSCAVDLDSPQVVVRGDLERVVATASQILGLVLLSIISVLFLFMFLIWLCAPPSNTALLSQFKTYHSELDTLGRMSQEDMDADGIRITDNFKKLEIDWAWARPKPKRRMTLERWTEYRRLLRQVDLSGFDKDKLGNVYLIAYATNSFAGGAASGRSKGFVHCINAGDRDKAFLPCTEQRDRGQVEAADDKGHSYRNLGQNWYLFETSARAVRDQVAPTTKSGYLLDSTN